MPPTKPQSNPSRKPVKKIKVLQLKQTQQKSLASEYFYWLLLALVGAISLVLLGIGWRLDESIVVGLWVGGIIFVAKQIRRYVKGESDAPGAAKKPEKRQQPMASIPEKYTPPELPRVSKDFSPMPPAGDKRYPPPSPFIKPPK